MRTKIGPFAIFAALLLAAFAGPTNNSPAGSASALCGVCDSGEDCAIEGDVCCPHAPGPDVPFTCAPESCFR